MAKPAAHRDPCHWQVGPGCQWYNPKKGLKSTHPGRDQTRDLTGLEQGGNHYAATSDLNKVQTHSKLNNKEALSEPDEQIQTRRNQGYFGDRGLEDEAQRLQGA